MPPGRSGPRGCPGPSAPAPPPLSAVPEPELSQRAPAGFVSLSAPLSASPRSCREPALAGADARPTALRKQPAPRAGPSAHALSSGLVRGRSGCGCRCDTCALGSEPAARLSRRFDAVLVLLEALECPVLWDMGSPDSRDGAERGK